MEYTTIDEVNRSFILVFLSCMTREELRNGRFFVGLFPFELMAFLVWEKFVRCRVWWWHNEKFPEIPQISELLPNQGNIP